MRKNSKRHITEIAESIFKASPGSRINAEWTGESLTKTTSFYQGKIDITTLFNFQEIAGFYDLTQSECDELVNKAQKIADKKIASYINN